MGRHTADQTAAGSPNPYDRGKGAGHRVPRRASAATRADSAQAAQDFDRLVDPHRADLRAYILRLTEGDEAVADSVIKETLYRAWREPERHPRNPAFMRPWLLLTALDVLRDGERHAPAGHDDRPHPPYLSSRRPETSTAPVPVATIAASMEDLTAEHRELIVAMFYGGVSLDAAAADRGVPVETVKSSLYFAMQALRAALERRLAGRRDTTPYDRKMR